jgi:uncharacterized RmlC-like cupin family protein
MVKVQKGDLFYAPSGVAMFGKNKVNVLAEASRYDKNKRHGRVLRNLF